MNRNHRRCVAVTHEPAPEALRDAPQLALVEPAADRRVSHDAVAAAICALALERVGRVTAGDAPDGVLH